MPRSRALAFIMLMNAGTEPPTYSAMAVLASPVKRYTDAATAQLADQAAYARAVLGITGAPTTRPYDGQRTPAAAPTEETR